MSTCKSLSARITPTAATSTCNVRLVVVCKAAANFQTVGRSKSNSSSSQQQQALATSQQLYKQQRSWQFSTFTVGLATEMTALHGTGKSIFNHDIKRATPEPTFLMTSHEVPTSAHELPTASSPQAVV